MSVVNAVDTAFRHTQRISADRNLLRTSFEMSTYAHMSIPWTGFGDLLYFCMSVHSVGEAGNSKLMNDPTQNHRINRPVARTL